MCTYLTIFWGYIWIQKWAKKASQNLQKKKTVIIIIIIISQY